MRVIPSFNHMLKRSVIFFVIWLVLSGGAVKGLAPGALAAIGAAYLSLRLMPPQGYSLVGLIALWPRFMWRSLLGGIDVAWRALHPSKPLRAGWLEHPTALPHGGPRVALGSEMSLMPGTLIAGSRGDTLYVHCLDTSQDVTSVLSGEERRIAALLTRGRERQDG
ncbi:Na+/H+ antiporter subunit E [Lutibaculum baratangense]|uniref:Na(+) H(+) antiporter subunit E n=1 Tax=Lutibaculum baratangense AMV1 TaxID=631454 RepID=V4QXQ2_9HYPH|nr:Na+/H+ antiporter subunit E [Lutibaculum baratangense]ESR24512.1 hypothetical protein N177_2346 [Lutibaculum baratangense AMV1]